MNNTTTQNNTPATPAKKQWQKPDFYLLDNGEINSGNIAPNVLEGQATPNNLPGTGTPNDANFYQS